MVKKSTWDHKNKEKSWEMHGIGVVFKGNLTPDAPQIFDGEVFSFWWFFFPTNPLNLQHRTRSGFPSYSHHILTIQRRFFRNSDYPVSLSFPSYSHHSEIILPSYSHDVFPWKDLLENGVLTLPPTHQSPSPQPSGRNHPQDQHWPLLSVAPPRKGRPMFKWFSGIILPDILGIVIIQERGIPN